MLKYRYPNIYMFTSS